MGALFDPVNRTSGGAKWPLVAHTAAMFLFVTIYTSMYLNLQSISFIDNREYSGANGGLPPGPLGYQHLIYNRAVSVVPHLMFMLNTWLADSLLVSILGNVVPRESNAVAISALPLLRYLCYELLGHRFSVPDVPRVFRYVLESSAN